MEEASLPLCGCGGWIHRRHGTPFIRRISLLSDGVGVDAIDDEVGDRRSMLLTAEKDIFGEFAGKFFLYQGRAILISTRYEDLFGQATEPLWRHQFKPRATKIRILPKSRSWSRRAVSY
jgi:hypothetical protein